MKRRYNIMVTILVIAVFLINSTVCAASGESSAPGNLYALSAVLMDGDSGRVLYEKEGETPRANASTTKVLTCILALENGKGDDYVQVSSNAAAQPDVRLGIQKGEQYYLEDLLYSLMLQSHNDAAVAIAEHIGGSVEGFAAMMNQKAKEIGCTDTHFVTPNGLDARDSGGSHHTTARDLALIMRYAIQNPMFLKITETRDYSFSDIEKKRTFSLHNANAFLDMREGILSGKTGYTGDAGYCYVCAEKKDDRTFIVVLLGSGWPNHKTYKWKDTAALLNYGEENYKYRSWWKEPDIPLIQVKNGFVGDPVGRKKIYLHGLLDVSEEQKEARLLLSDRENVTCQVKVPSSIEAPISRGDEIGQVTFRLNGELLSAYPVLAEQSVGERTFSRTLEHVSDRFFH